MIRVRTLLPVLVAATAIAGCDRWFGERDAPPLPGERISVLAHQGTLTPDPSAQTAEILLPRPTINSEWPQQGGYTNHAMHHILVGDLPQPLWRTSIGEGSDDEERFVAAPVIAGGRVFAMDSEHRVSAFDAATGDGLWRVELTPEEEDDGHVSGGLAYDDGILYASTGFGQVIALDAATGEDVWWRQLDGPIRSAPTARGGRVFVITVGNKIFALNAYTGEDLWTHSGITETASILGGASPAVDGGVVVAPFSSGELVALRVENGRNLWTDSLSSARRTEELATLAQIRGHPVIDRGRVFALSHGGILAAIDLRTGQRVWDKEIGGLESPWIAGQYLFLITSDAELVCLDRDDGRILWVSQLPEYEDPEDRTDPILWARPMLVSDRLLVVGNHGWVLAVSPYTGDIIGQEPMPDAVTVAPVVADGSIFFLSDDAELTAYR